MQDLVGGSNALLTRNFRSLPPVIDWVNHVFPHWMTESDGQAGYSPLAAGPRDSESPTVRFMGGGIGGNIVDVRRQEADAIVGAISTAIEEGWKVRSETDHTETRPAKYQDVCVLMPSRLGLDSLEFAFETAGIPYRLDSAGLIYESQEARDLLNCLSAIDDPTDQVSVVAALRSPGPRLLRRRPAGVRRVRRAVRLPCRRRPTGGVHVRRSCRPERFPRTP